MKNLLRRALKKIKEIPIQTDEDLKRFPLFIDDNYKNRAKFLKPGADKGMSRENWFEYVYKIHQNKPILYKQNDPLFAYNQTGLSGLDFHRKQLKEERKAAPKKSKHQPKEILSLPQGNPTVTDPAS